MSSLLPQSTWSRWILGILPLALLGLAIGLFVQFDPMQPLTGNQPPVEELSIQRIELGSEGIVAHVVNAGPEPVTIAQVLIDDAYWSFEITPDHTLDRLERARVHIPYPWVHGEKHEVRLITSNGVTFSRDIEVATATPRPTPDRWLLFALVGTFVGIVPVGLGLMWFPLLQRLSPRAMNFILALTVGLLVFLFIDTILEGLEIAERMPDVFQAIPLIFFTALLSFLALVAVGRRDNAADPSTARGRLWIATAIAIGIGLHNLGEGMAIGAAIATGEAALGSFLVIGFTLHNVTEGVGIGAPMAQDEPGLPRLVGLTLLAGVPAILGCWIGGFSYSPLLALIFLAIGTGAILQVIVEVSRLLLTETPGVEQAMTSWVNIGGVTTGLAIMYATALLV